MLYWNEFSAWVTVDGKEATEYDVEISQEQKTVTCWIASELGKKFSVHWKNASYYGDTNGQVKMDGIPCGGKLLYSRALPVAAEKDGVSDGVTMRPFVFSSLELSDDDALLSSSSSHRDLGVIELTINPAYVAQQIASTNYVSLSQLKVHERSKKAVTQQITLGKSEVVAKRGICVSTVRAGPDIVKFSFKYRPLDILRANGIAPQAPQLKRKASVGPSVASTSGTKDVPTGKKAKVLSDQSNTAGVKKEKKPRIKSESNDVLDLTQDEPAMRNKTVKTERKRPLIKGEVIDLT